MTMLTQKDKEEILLLSAQGYGIKRIMRHFPDANEGQVKKIIATKEWGWRE